MAKTRKQFDASQFTPTKWSTAEDKAKFANHFARFVSGGFQEKQFPKWFYTRLSLCFGHIAHYNIDGFYGTFFTCPQNQLIFLKQCAGQFYGDPAFTFSDVEKVLAKWIVESGTMTKVAEIVDKSTRENGIAARNLLLAKYHQENADEQWRG